MEVVDPAIWNGELMAFGLLERGALLVAVAVVAVVCVVIVALACEIEDTCEAIVGQATVEFGGVSVFRVRCKKNRLERSPLFCCGRNELHA